MNAFETVSGTFIMRVNEHRSYDIVAEVVVGDASALENPGMRAAACARRKDAWKLYEQTYSYDSVPSGVDVQLEMNGIYTPYIEVLE